MYEIFVTKNFSKALKKLHEKERRRIKNKLRVVAKNPWLYFLRLRSLPFFRLRIGKYRIIAQIIPSKKRITLLSIVPRRTAYKKLRKNKQQN